MPGPPGSGVTSPARRNRTRSINWLSPVDVPDVSETARLWSSRRQSQRLCICVGESGRFAPRVFLKRARTALDSLERAACSLLILRRPRRRASKDAAPGLRLAPFEARAARGHLRVRIRRASSLPDTRRATPSSPQAIRRSVRPLVNMAHRAVLRLLNCTSLRDASGHLGMYVNRSRLIYGTTPSNSYRFIASIRSFSLWAIAARANSSCPSVSAAEYFSKVSINVFFDALKREIACPAVLKRIHKLCKSRVNAFSRTNWR